MAQITIMAVYGFCGDTPWWPPQVIYGSHHHNENIKALKKYAWSSDYRELMTPSWFLFHSQMTQ